MLLFSIEKNNNKYCTIQYLAKEPLSSINSKNPIMKQITLICILFFVADCSFAQNPQKIEVNKEYSNLEISGNIDYRVKLEKGRLYAFSVLQKGIDVQLILTNDEEQPLLEKDSPNGQNGYEKFEYSPKENGQFILKIERLEEYGNSENGQITIFIKKYTKEELKLREKIKKELEPENRKTVQTLDIDHFWEAFDKLETCKSLDDSIATFQTVYLDRATDGLKDFIVERDFTAEDFVDAVAVLPKFYNSIRKSTYEVKSAVPLIEEIVEKFSQIYPGFEPHKVCFAIGVVNTGGTVSEDFLLIGTEIVTSTNNTDLSEFTSKALKEQLASSKDIVQRVKDIVAHEYVHTQQPPSKYDENAIKCSLLYRCMREGFCDFIGELISGSKINLVAQEYGDQREKELWIEFKSELCNNNPDNWLYNYSTTEEKPADLGYYIGYKIAEEYYNNSKDKQQAVIDIIEMDDPITFLQKSKYDQKVKE